jgi:predicted transcriptional regulator of viral defense system
MKKSIREKINEIFLFNNGYIRTKDLLQNHIHNFYLKQLEEEGWVIKVKRGLYKLSSLSIANEIADVSKMIPCGILCLDSAASYYELTTFNPSKYMIAVPRGYKIVLQNYPPIKIIYFSEKEYNTGIAEESIEGIIIKIFDVEKTVCDIVRYRNKIGIDITKEVINNYLKSKNKNISKLIEYAKKLRIYNQLSLYLEVLL